MRQSSFFPTKNKFFVAQLAVSLVIAVATPSIAKQRDHEVIFSSTTILDIVELAEFSGVGVCEHRQRVAMRISQSRVDANTVNHRWVIIDWPSGGIVADVDAGASLINTQGGYESLKPRWSLDCNSLYFRALRNNEVQIWKLDINSGQQRQITTDDGNVLAFHLSQDARSIIYEADAPRKLIDDAETRLYEQGALIDKTMYPASPLFESLPIHGKWRAMRVWGATLPGHLNSQDPNHYKVITLDEYSVRDADQSEIINFQKLYINKVDWFPEPVSSKNAQAIAAQIEDDEATVLPQKVVLALVNHDDHLNLERCKDNRCVANTVIPLSWSPQEDKVYFIAENRGALGASVLSWSPSAGDVHTVFESDGTLGALTGPYRFRSLQCPVAKEIAFCTMADHSQPPRLVALNLRSGEITTVFDPNRQLRNQFSLNSELVQWNDKFGRIHNGVLILPRSFKENINYPLILTTYRCPGFLVGGTADGGPEYVLAEHGFVVLCIDSNDEYPPFKITSKESIGPAQYVAALAEYESAIHMLSEKNIVDSERVGATGMSFGSQAVSFALTRSDIFDAVALTSIGVWEPSWEPNFIPGSEYTNFFLEFHKVGEGAYTRSEMYADISVTERADRVTAAILVQANDREYYGSLGAANQLMAANKPIEMHVFPDETHTLHQPIHRYVNFTRNVDWFRFWLQNYEDPDPEKDEQYERWRSLRALQKATQP